MSKQKRIAIGLRPPVAPQAQAWVREGEGSSVSKRDLYAARLTVDVTCALRARIKVEAFTQGVTVADMLRTLLNKHFRKQHHEVIHRTSIPCTTVLSCICRCRSIRRTNIRRFSLGRRCNDNDHFSLV